MRVVVVVVKKQQCTKTHSNIFHLLFVIFIDDGIDIGLKIGQSLAAIQTGQFLDPSYTYHQLGFIEYALG